MSVSSGSPRRLQSKSRSPSLERSPVANGRSLSRSRSRSPRSRSLSRSARRSPSRSSTPRRRNGRSISPISPRRRSSSRSPIRRRSRSRSRPLPGDWKATLDDLQDRGYVRASELDHYTMEALQALPQDLANCAVARFSEANFSRISNKSGFLMGIIRRVQEDGPDRGSEDLDILPRSVRHRLTSLVDQGRLRRDDIDARMAKALADLPSDLGLEAVDKFAMANLDTVRSKTGFMMGIIKRVQMDAMPPRYGGYGGGGGYGGPPRARYGDRYGGGGYRGYDDRHGDRYGGGYRDRY